MNLIPAILFAILVCGSVDGRDTNRIHRRGTKEDVAGLEAQMKILKKSLEGKPLPDGSPVPLIIKELDETVTKMKNAKPGAGEIAAKHFESAEKVVKSVTDNLETFKKGDALEIAKAVADIVGAVASFVPPPAGTIISSVMGILSNIMGIFAPKDKQKSMADIVGEVIRSELKNHYKAQLQYKVEGVHEHIDTVQDFLREYMGKNLNKHEQIVASGQVNAFKHIKLAGEIHAFIRNLSITGKEEDASNAAALIDSYVILTSMNELLMFSMQSIFIKDKRDTNAKAFGSAIEGSRKRLKERLSFLRNPEIENGLVIAAYDPAKHPMVEKRMNFLGIPNNTVSLDPESCYSIYHPFHNKFLAEAHDPHRDQWGGWSGTKGIAKFNKNTLDGYWKITRIFKEEKKTVCAPFDYDKKDTVKQATMLRCGECDQYPDVRSQFIITKFSDGDDSYMIMNRGQKKRVPLWMMWGDQSYRVTGEDVRNDDTAGLWQERKENREYVWQIMKTSCVILEGAN